ncbi:MAG: hypothetical protein Q9159_002130 [Coniocarpon cinnabarinum]
MDADVEVSDSREAPAILEQSGDELESQQERGEKHSSDNKFQRAISSWRNIDLTKLVPNLDTTASDLVAQQRDALIERKELAQKTKDFRKLDDGSKLNEVKSLLKAYQGYIDLVTNHSKTVHSSFLHVYSLLSEAPDPYPLLEASVDSLVTADETVPKLEAEKAHLQAANAKLSSQLDDAETKLKHEVLARQSLQEQGDARVKEAEQSWSAVLAEKEDNWSSKEKSLEERVDNQDRLVKELKASYEVSQRLGKNDESAAQSAASAAELSILNTDLERVNNRLVAVEARNEQMRLELAQKATAPSVDIRSAPVEEDPAFLRLRTENFSLMRKTDEARFERDALRRDWDSSMRALKREISMLTEDRDNLRTRMRGWQDYEDVKRELEILKSIEFATGDNEDEVEARLNDEEAVTDEGSVGRQPLERLLMARNKKLNNELTVMRVSHQDLASQLERLKRNFTDNSAELDRLHQLNATLENDLSKIQYEGAAEALAMSAVGTHVSRHPGATIPRKGRASPTSSIISGIDGARGPGDVYGAGSGMLPMITAQRDRFKKRITELEAENAKAYKSVSALRSEIAALQKDNLNLYEKTRYVSAYGRNQPAAATATLNPNPSTIQMSENGTALDRYKSAYESHISPFAAFRGHESMRAMKRMSLIERAFLQATKVVLANRVSRNLFALYLLALHIVLFGVLVSPQKREAHPLSGTRAIGAEFGLSKDTRR